MASTLEVAKLKKVLALLQELSPVIVAFSGGVDSTLLLKLAIDALGSDAVLAVTGASPSISLEERENAAALARRIGARFLTIETREMESPDYVSNPVNRCYFCKEELFSRLENIRRQKEFKTVVDGSNADDAKEWRPGMKAAARFGVRSPLLEAGLTKDEIRALSKQLDLPTWDKPAMPCLSSRVPYGEAITVERLSRIHEAEQLLRNAGFRDVRVRDHFPIARIEVPKEEMIRLTGEPLRDEIVAQFKQLGYAFVTVDLAGFKSGSLNPPRLTV